MCRPTPLPASRGRRLHLNRHLCLQAAHSSHKRSNQSGSLPPSLKIVCNVAVAPAGRPQAYLLYRGALLEVNRFRHKHAAWFVGQRILSNGSIYLATPLDPLFFALPMLQVRFAGECLSL